MASEPTTSADAPDPTGGALVTVPTVGSMSERAHAEIAQLDAELSEIELLITQARAEASRHEQKRIQASDRLPAVRDPVERADLATQLVTLTRRAAVMESQVEVLEGKRKALTRYREGLSALGDGLASVAARGGSDGGLVGDGPLDATEGLPPAMSRIILGAQEDLRREIARAMHDGPAQSLTNIVLQAQIVERLVARDPSAAAGELRMLVSMVQQTLEATKTFIFDVRPMVLDDLGLVPTMRRAARDRGRRARVAVEFDSMGTDRRLPMEIESAVFRILDESLGGYLGAGPERVQVRLDWSDMLEALVAAERDVVLPPDEEVPTVAPPPAKGKKGEELPPALAQMIEARKADHEAAIEEAHRAAVVALPANVRRDIVSRAASIGAELVIADDGSSVRLVLPLSPLDPAAGPVPEA
jgi:two-component system, NarL family, sensor histidine kinase DegS